MKLHREGTLLIIYTLITVAVLSAGNYFLFLKLNWIYLLIAIELFLLVFLYLVIQFFRIPKRHRAYSATDIVCPADGKVVVIEETYEPEYFKDQRLQVSIFMSPLNVHANYYPINGTVTYQKYHPGKFLVAWHPKSSTENERTTMVIAGNDTEIMVRQIAGAVARRICFYPTEGQFVEMGSEFGFIKFGSRIDLYLPLGTKIDVAIGDVVKAKLTRIGELN
mgnify:CR=1 FL=1